MSKQPTSQSPSLPVEEIIENITMSFDPFLVPNYVKIKHIGPFTGPSELARIPVIPLRGIPDTVLDRLVETLIRDIYAGAGRENPFFHKNDIAWGKAEAGIE
jgi:hypothetical protein